MPPPAARHSVKQEWKLRFAFSDSPAPIRLPQATTQPVATTLPASSIRFVSGLLRPKAAKAVSLRKLLMIRPSRIVPTSTVIREMSDTEKRLFTTLRMIRSSFFRTSGISGDRFLFMKRSCPPSCGPWGRTVFQGFFLLIIYHFSGKTVNSKAGPRPRLPLGGLRRPRMRIRRGNRLYFDPDLCYIRHTG